MCTAYLASFTVSYISNHSTAGFAAATMWKWNERNKTLVDSKCAKCNKVVRNGIFCNNYDELFHFNKCNMVSTDNIQGTE
jgi:hypothetical protein